MMPMRANIVAPPVFRDRDQGFHRCLAFGRGVLGRRQLSDVIACIPQGDSWRPRGHGIECKPEGGLSQHQLSVRREAIHIRGSRFKLTKIVRIFLRIGAERETSHEAGVARASQPRRPHRMKFN
jgi:hypothetical protein